MVWAFHQKANQKREHKVCQACLIDARLRGKKRLTSQPMLPCQTHGTPFLWPDNVTAWQVWSLVNAQVFFLMKTQKEMAAHLNFAALVPVVQLYEDTRRAQQLLLEKLILCHRITQSRGVFDFFKTV